jgi:hypothetical protein
MSAGSDVDARSLADGWALADVAEFERLFRDLVALINRGERAIPPQARHALERAIVEAADAALERAGGAAAAAPPDLACLDPWRASLARRSRPRASLAAAPRAVPAGPYDSAGEWTFL